ncbi:TPA: lycopene cyclase domain-containing protein [Candidatus Saccharibacteria bacterium]|nr:lycopene cyclase domain-containing protein [Candidatus Saccharibacteria bacterium]HIO87291.1 lycopene cyclase domain-containing protein [Candidatus Saccharibacteria bacterium]
MTEFPSYGYLIILLISLFGTITLDKRFKRALFKDFKAAAIAMSATVFMLLIADIIGIELGIFFTNTDYTTGINLLTPDLPVEELLLLALISHSTLLVFNTVDTNG